MLIVHLVIVIAITSHSCWSIIFIVNAFSVQSDNAICHEGDCFVGNLCPDVKVEKIKLSASR